MQHPGALIAVATEYLHRAVAGDDGVHDDFRVIGNCKCTVDTSRSQHGLAKGGSGLAREFEPCGGGEYNLVVDAVVAQPLRTAGVEDEFETGFVATRELQ